MPSALTYPGVYVEELESLTRTITGVATSVAAFVGRTKRGPVDTAVTITSYGDFERIFGGLWLQSPLSFAVRDFFLNGGAQAIIVRLFAPNFPDGGAGAQAGADKVAKAATDEVAGAPDANAVAAAAEAAAKALADEEKVGGDKVAKAARDSVANAAAPADVATAAKNAAKAVVPNTVAKLNIDTIKLAAASGGEWGNKLRVRIDHDVDPAQNGKLFNLSVRDDGTGTIELFRNVSYEADNARRIDKVLENGSRFVRMLGSLPDALPKETETDKKKGPWDDVNSITVAAADKGTDGDALSPSDFTPDGAQANKRGLYALEQADLFNILCIPPLDLDGTDIDIGLWSEAAKYCLDRRAFLLIDPPSGWISIDKVNSDAVDVGDSSTNAAVFFPRLVEENDLRDRQLEEFAPCGAVAGLFARTDASRGVWKAPAGIDARLTRVSALTVPMTDKENGLLNPLGVNCIRAMPAAGNVVWGARTRDGDDRLASQWKYIPVRRTALFIEESLYRGTQWVVFEPNDEALWAQIRLNIGAFMQRLFRQGAFQGESSRDAYFVKCDSETTTQPDIDLGIVNIIVGFAPLKPAEFVIIKLQQIAGDIQAS